VLKDLPEQSVNTCITSPPYWGLRDYGKGEQLGLEDTPEEFVESLVKVFREVKRVLRDDGTVWLNLGDSYASSTKGSGGKTNSTLNAKRDLSGNLSDDRKSQPSMKKTKNFDLKKIGLKAKDLVGIPWRVAFALQADGWYLRQDIIWHKPNPMPESVRDRCTKAHEYIFLLSKNAKYYFDNEAIKEDAEQKIKSNRVGKKERVDYRPQGTIKDVVTGSDKTTVRTNKRNKRSVWTVTTKPYSEAHFATYPPDLIQPCVLAGCPEGGTVLDPFGGAGTTGLVAQQNDRDSILIELNPDYIEIAKERLNNDAPLFNEVVA
tara:strand:+ start:430 stop:1383 length:954 start_codon:yes stop_codon:yes gene_type:complete